MELKRDDLKTKVKGFLIALVWKDKQNLNIADEHAFSTIGG
jgi:hypothetical protein